MGPYTQEQIDDMARRSAELDNSVAVGRGLVGSDAEARLNRIFQEEFGRNVDLSGLGTYANMDEDSVRDAIRNSPEYYKTKVIPEAVAKGESWYAGGGDTGMEFSASSGGEMVFLREGQNVAGEYEDITGQLGGWVPKGMRAYVDQGTSTGFFGLLDQTFGTDFFSNTLQDAIPNELKAALIPLPTAAAAIGGTQWANDTSDIYADLLGIQRDEYYKFGGLLEDIGIAAAGIINPWASVALSAGKGVLTKLTYDNMDWSDIAENTAWSALATASGGVGGGLVRAAQAKAQGGDWSDSAVFAAAALAGGGKLTPEQSALMAGGVSALTGGDRDQAIAAAIGSYAGSIAGAKAPERWSDLARAGTQAAFAYATRDPEADNASAFAQAIQPAVLAAAGGGSGALQKPDFKGFFDRKTYTSGEFGGLKQPGSWVSPTIYNPDTLADERWFNPTPTRVYRGGRVVDSRTGKPVDLGNRDNIKGLERPTYVGV